MEAPPATRSGTPVSRARGRARLGLAAARLVLGRQQGLQRQDERGGGGAFDRGPAETHHRPGVLLDRVALRLGFVDEAAQVHRLVRERVDRLDVAAGTPLARPVELCLGDHRLQSIVARQSSSLRALPASKRRRRPQTSRVRNM